MRIVTRVWSSEEHYNAEAEYAYVVIDERLAKVIAGRFALFDACKKSNPDLVQMHFTAEDVECGFYRWLGFSDDSKFLPGSEAEEHFDENGWCEIPADSPFKGDLSRDSFDEVFGIEIEGPCMVIDPQGVYWEAAPKHAGINISSEVIPREVISRVI